MSKKTKDNADAAAPENELETETQSADANQPDNSAVGAVHLEPDTTAAGAGELANAGAVDSGTIGAVQNGASAPETAESDADEQNSTAGYQVTSNQFVPPAELVGDHAIQKNVSTDGTAAEGNGEASQPSDEGPEETEGAAEGSNDGDAGGGAEPQPPARDSELTYRPLMTDEDIARAATDAAIAVAYQAGFASTLTDEDELVLKLIAPVAVDFIKQWPDAPLEAMYVHIATSAGLPHDRFSARPNWVRLGLAVFHSVVLLSIDAVKVHEKEWEAAKVRQAGLRWMAVDRADLAMMPEDDNPLSELGQAAARS
ncbi:hypothetical protein GJU93_05975 [Brucella sp. 10RB9212]|uniref:hypothetical protein n=1 Tax=unclassified Brucella TaxID=2632610 RepID=UPI00097271C6|nr:MULTISPECIES: hypothetical protein [unclassified Brucella]APY13177.1 hypothetical protein BKD02_01650 [Brucella sp. 09RB8910]MRN46138.1 hypothetical protein [Brucella sp. 10RB9212]